MVDASNIATISVQAQVSATAMTDTHHQTSLVPLLTTATQTTADVLPIQYVHIQDLAKITAHATPDTYLIRYQA